MISIFNLDREIVKRKFPNFFILLFYSTIQNNFCIHAESIYLFSVLMTTPPTTLCT
eukprot:m.165773 g.165773  ORF g.165773 m.165773 type:complete len:56 (+) comp15266_c0_seq5:2563-2730(+)